MSDHFEPNKQSREIECGKVADMGCRLNELQAMASVVETLMHELNALANRNDAIRIAVKGAIPSETCGVIGIRYLLADAATRLRDLMGFGPKGITRPETLGDV